MKSTTNKWLFAALTVSALAVTAWMAPAVLGASPSGTPEEVQVTQGTADEAVAIPARFVALTATTTAATYPAGTPIGIVATLTNRSGRPLGLSNIEDGNLVITSYSGGSADALLPTMTAYEDGFALALSGSLVSVAPGASLSIPWSTDFVQDFGGEGLKSTTYTGDFFGKSSYFDVSQPGTYTIKFHYQYPGPTSSFPGTVFTGKTNTASVTFTVI